MKNKLSIIMVMVFFLIMPLTISDGDSEGRIILPWYEVEDWELEVCEKWGGVKGVNNALNTINVFLAETSVAVQGKKIVQPNGQFYYEYSYYLHPFSGSFEFALRLANSENEEFHKLVSPITVGEAGMSGFNVLELPEEYDQIQLRYNNEILKMPLVGEDGGYSDTAQPQKGSVSGASESNWNNW